MRTQRSCDTLLVLSAQSDPLTLVLRYPVASLCVIGKRADLLRLTFFTSLQWTCARPRRLTTSSQPSPLRIAVSHSRRVSSSIDGQLSLTEPIMETQNRVNKPHSISSTGRGHPSVCADMCGRASLQRPRASRRVPEHGSRLLPYQHIEIRRIVPESPRRLHGPWLDETCQSVAPLSGPDGVPDTDLLPAVHAS